MRKLMNLNYIYDIFVKNENNSFGKKRNIIWVKNYQLKQLINIRKSSTDIISSFQRYINSIMYDNDKPSLSQY